MDVPPTVQQTFSRKISFQGLKVQIFRNKITNKKKTGTASFQRVMQIITTMTTPPPPTTATKT